ncbi:MAG: electron transfer flavoprotein subunit beta/FixA family protein [Deltaproteobacteria bacterium]|nr:electron transfer flavoprotein subunit beta/FixA family protein [Deltaproteobacteria bacterium]
MEVLCLAKRVLDYQSKLSISDMRVLSESGRYILNPFDEIAIEEAVRWKEKGLVNKIIVLSVGEDEQAIRYGLSMGADCGVLIKTPEVNDPLFVSKTIFNYCKGRDFKIILAGKQAIDTDSGQIPARVASLLNWPFIPYASKIDIYDSTVVVEKEVDKGIEVVSARIPCVITVDLRLNTPRFPPLPAVLKAKQKPVDVVQPDFEAGQVIEIQSLQIPTKVRQRRQTTSVSEFVDEIKKIL